MITSGCQHIRTLPYYRASSSRLAVLRLPSPVSDLQSASKLSFPRVSPGKLHDASGTSEETPLTSHT